MKFGQQSFISLCISLTSLVMVSRVCAQDSSRVDRLDSFISSRKGLFGKIVKNLLADTAETQFQRNDVRYQRFQGKVIRNIDIKVLNFGIAITDTTKSFSNSAIHLANVLHHKTRAYVIHNSLFFHKGDRLQPFLIADNERHLRDRLTSRMPASKLKECHLLQILWMLSYS